MRRTEEIQQDQERPSLVTKPNCTKTLPDPYIGDGGKFRMTDEKKKMDEHTTTTKSVQTI